MDVILYIHGKGGSAEEAEHYKQLFPSCDVIGLAYKGFTPWEAGMEIHAAVAELNAVRSENCSSPRSQPQRRMSNEMGFGED